MTDANPTMACSTAGVPQIAIGTSRTVAQTECAGGIRAKKSLTIRRKQPRQAACAVPRG